MKEIAKLLFGGLALALCATAQAAADPILIVKGKIGVFNNASRTEYRFDEGSLLRLPQRTISTKTTWTAKSAFSGPAISDILRVVAAGGSQIDVVTYDEYKVTLPLSDLERYHPIMARFINGKPLQRRDFGPLWVMYPVSDFAELQKVKSDAKLAWQVKYIVVR
ncbi:hypothetical protein [Chromobacterium sphagni]|uniref:Oxidoreductase n=1 Tax=Chromobacterium sphagni TaxID=1903179 RepID=A0A1S1WYN7_9NEIS|nr:hypothetical protein [Chromobacterium sphagni]OHX12421.1 hypothetical protein BI347_02105 [Chromobacterium sphagni]OHX21493.1 hypothetical protein BI344_02900 [Chromobacterium sphagni]